MIEHFCHPGPAADEWLQVAPGKAPLLHRKQNRLDRVRRVDGPVPFFPRLHQRDQHIKTVAFRSVWPGVHQPVDFLQRFPVVAIVLDRPDFHAHTSSTLIRSYCACVPMNRTYITRYGKFTFTTSRYLFPPILNTTRLLATILAVPNAALIAAGLVQSAFDASLNHALSDCSASAYSGFCQNSRSVLREMILIIRTPLWHDPMLGATPFIPLIDVGQSC